MDLNQVKTKFRWNNILAIAAVMVIVFAFYKIFVRQYITSDGVLHTTFKTPNLGLNED